MSLCGTGVDFIRACYRRQAKLFVDDDTLYWITWRKCQPQALTLPFPTPYSSAIWDSNGAPLVNLGEVGKRQWIADQLSDEAGQDYIGSQDEWQNGFSVNVLSLPPPGECLPVYAALNPTVWNVEVDVSVNLVEVDHLGFACGVFDLDAELFADSVGESPGASEVVSASASSGDSVGFSSGASQTVTGSYTSSSPVGEAIGVNESVIHHP